MSTKRRNTNGNNVSWLDRATSNSDDLILGEPPKQRPPWWAAVALAVVGGGGGWLGGQFYDADDVAEAKRVATVDERLVTLKAEQTRLESKIDRRLGEVRDELKEIRGLIEALPRRRR